MLKEQAQFVIRFTIACDMLLVFCAFALAYFVRMYYWGGLDPFLGYIWVVMPAMPLWYYLIARHGLYGSFRRHNSIQIIRRLFNVHLMAGVVLAAVVLFIDREHFSRGLLLLFICFSLILLILERVAARKILGMLRRRGYNFRNCLIVGTREKAHDFIRLVEQHTDWGLRVCGLLQVSTGELKDEVAGYPVHGKLEDIELICKQRPVDEVVFCVDKNQVVDIEEQLLILEELGITVRMILDFYTLDRYQRDLSFFNDNTPILTFHLKSLDAQQLFLKRCLDVLGSLVGLMITALILPFVYVLMRLEDGGPVFFSQYRLGENGRKFKIWKFRSMGVDAEGRKEALRADNEMNGAIFKIKDDPRVTKVGKFLRKTSLDEFPQFWNVFKGEMSLVGTRPPTPDEVEHYENWHRRRITIKPGITGMWQVNGRNCIEDFDEIVKLDLRYIDGWNIWLDIRILLKTLWVVLARQGSC